MKTQPFRGWPPEAFNWFRELESNNNRDWFQAHRPTYDNAVRGPLEWLLEELSDEFGDARVTRPNRDTRFSADKSPYKRGIYAVVERGGGGGGWYVHLDKEGLFAGGGIYAPERQKLAAIRSAIADDATGKKLESIIAGMSAAGLRLMDEGSLKTAPRGYPKDHPRVGLLRLQHLAAGINHPPQEALHTSKAKELVVDAWRAVSPLLDWVAAADRT
jgi:uncharacterized protein (TIGR02453 family)